MKVAITGGIGSGKSYVCQMLSQRGINIYDCDSAAKRLMRTSEKLRQQLTALIGPGTYLPDGTLNKRQVSQFLLQSEHHARAIDDIVHPAVAEDFELSGCHWMEAAILYESGFDRFVDSVIVVTAPEDVRIDRIVHRDGLTPAKARQWMQRQWPQEQLVARADYQIVNDGLQPLSPQIDHILEQLETCRHCGA